MNIEQLHILVAESDPARRSSLIELLVQAGASQVSEAADGPSALRHLQAGLERPVDLALIDLTLAGMDGLALIHHLAEARPGAAPAAALILFGEHGSGILTGAEAMAQAYGVKVLGVLPQPANPVLLGRLLHQHVAPAPRPVARVAPLPLSIDELAEGMRADQFEPYFQPKIELESGHVTGLEAFARWVHPQHGLLAPASFMAVLEASDRVDFLDWRIIEKSVAACAALHQQGMPVLISVNVAPATLAQPTFIAQLDACLERHRLEPDYITLELPESVAQQVAPQMLEQLLRLRMRGYGLAIDDFGSGNCNLQMLAKIPFTELKLDRSFVDGASKKRAIGIVMGACLAMARNLDRSSVAVGVETEDDWVYLQELGCTYAQGYYIAKPMPIRKFPNWLKDWRDFF